MKRRKKITTLCKRLKYWQKVLKLDSWNITITYVKPEKMQSVNNLAQLDVCRPPEKIASILVSDKYYHDENFGLVWNEDTLIIHELIHVALWEKIDLLPDIVKERKDVKGIEEYISDYFSRIIFELVYKK